jgi:hypothetical protein
MVARFEDRSLDMLVRAEVPSPVDGIAARARSDTDSFFDPTIGPASSASLLELLAVLDRIGVVILSLWQVSK